VSSEQTATIVVAAVILHGGRILIQRKEKSNNPEIIGRHECPGGKVNFGEDFVSALKREVREELDLEVLVGRLLHSQINTYSDGVDYLVLFYHCTLRVPPKSLAGANFRFVLPDELEHYSPLPGAVEAVSKLGAVTAIREEFSFVQNDVCNQTLDETLHILTYELGRVVEYYHKSKRYGEEGFYCIENQKKEVSDLISMCRMYCEQRGWDFYKLMEFGEGCYLERMTDLKKHGEVRHKALEEFR